MELIVEELKREHSHKIEGTRIVEELKKGRRSAKSRETEEVIAVQEKDKYDFSLLHH